MRNKKGPSVLKIISRFILVISALGVALELWSRGMMNYQQIAIFLVLVVIATVIDSVWANLAIALAGIGFFLLNYLDYDIKGVYYSSIGIGALLLCLFGFYVMFGGLRKK
ncbi:MAG: hypothetical protein WBO28_01010 [Flavobacteriales bacterium]